MALLVAALAVFPWVGDFFDTRWPTSYELRLVMRAMILAIVVVGLNILVGFAGLVSLGQAALMGLGAHVAALLALRAGLPFGACMVLAVALTAAMGAILAFPTVRVRPPLPHRDHHRLRLRLRERAAGLGRGHRRRLRPHRHPAPDASSASG